MEDKLPADMEVRQHARYRARGQRQHGVGLEDRGEVEHHEHAAAVQEEAQRIARKKAQPLDNEMMLVARLAEGPQPVDEPVDRRRNEIGRNRGGRQSDERTQAVNGCCVPE